MYKQIEQIMSFKEIEDLLNHNNAMGEIGKDICSLEYKNKIKKTGARFLIKKSILDFISLDNGFDDISIKNEKNGKPIVSYTGAVSEKLKQMMIKNIEVSISHSRNFVATLVIIE